MQTRMRLTVAGSIALAGAAACGSNELQPISLSPTADGSVDVGNAGDVDASVLVDSGSPVSVDAGSVQDASVDPPSRKRGIAYGHHSNADLAALGALGEGVGWWYNWSPAPDTELGSDYANVGVEFVPMIWGGTFNTSTLATQVPANSKYLLTFNEPNFGSQSNLTPAQAAALWPQIESFAKGRGMKIVSPGVNFCGSPCNQTDPFVWLQDFFDACTGCQVDYIAMHWYACNKPAIVATLPKYEKFGKPLWVTEFSCLDDTTKVDDADELAYMQDAVAVLEADPMVFRYAWFTGRSTNNPPLDLLAPDSGQLTPLGQQYVSLPR